MAAMTRPVAAAVVLDSCNLMLHVSTCFASTPHAFMLSSASMGVSANLTVLACCCAGFVIAVWEVFAAAHPWKGMTMGEVMTAVMIEGRRLIWGPGVPKVGAPPLGQEGSRVFGMKTISRR